MYKRFLYFGAEWYTGTNQVSIFLLNSYMYRGNHCPHARAQKNAVVQGKGGHDKGVDAKADANHHQQTSTGQTRSDQIIIW